MLFATPKLRSADVRVIEEITSAHERLAFLVRGRRRWTGLLRRVLLARNIRGSNTIEGFEVTPDDAYAALDDEEPMEAGEQAWAAVLGYRQAMTYVLSLADDPSPISADLLRSLHFMMQSYDLSKLPGRWRDRQVYVLDEDAEATVYTAPDWELVPGLVDELVEQLAAEQARSQGDVLVAAAMAHLNLVMIHPFIDGNGRMARCLQTLLLARGGISAPEFASIEEYLGRNTHDYYAALGEVGGGRWQPDRDAYPWLRFCLTAHYRQVVNVQRRAKQAEKLWEVAEHATNAAGLPDRTTGPLFHALLGRRLRNQTYRQIEPEVSYSLASRDLADLVRAGLLEARGERRGRHYLMAARFTGEVTGIRDEVGRMYPRDADPYG